MVKKTQHRPSGDDALPLVIVNPGSASGSTRDNWTQTASELRAHFGPFSTAFTKGPGHGIELAERAAVSGRTFIIACGGDGTVNEVANGIIRSGCDAELGVLPSGTGGDFRRTLGLPRANRDAAAALRDGETRLMDAGKVTFNNEAGDIVTRYFLNVSSVGLAALVIKRVKRKAFDWLPIEALRGRVNFAYSTLQELMELDPVLIRIKIDDGRERTLRTISFCVANSRFFGGGMKIAPDATINDGLLDLVNIGDLSTAKILMNAYSLYRGTHQGLKEVRSTQARKVEVFSVDPNREIMLETDGEIPGMLPATYEIVPNALKVRVPRSS